MTRISRRVRAEAIEACLYLADHFNRDKWGVKARFTPAVESVLDDAFAAIPTCHIDGRDMLAMVYLETAALLRGGWSPGDPVRLLRGKP